MSLSAVAGSEGSPWLAAGLSDEEAARRLLADGPNELRASRPRSVWRIAGGVLREPMILLLLAAGTIYLLLGDPADAIVLIASIFAVTGISLYQNHKTERALDALRDLSSPRALVLRSGRRRRIPGREVVRGDLLLLSEGDRISADGVLLASVNLTTDESLLTGESVPVRKACVVPEPGRMGRPGGDDLPFVYSGTLVTGGQGVARALETGAATAMGRIGQMLRTATLRETRLQEETRRIVRVIALIGLVLCLLVAGISAATRGSLLGGLLAGLTLAMALVPEEFPVVLTVFLALGAWRLSRKQVLTRRVAAIEALGSATVLCVDKTGTLTQNRMSVARLVAGEGALDVAGKAPSELPAPFSELLTYARLAGQTAPFDPMELAIQDLARHALGKGASVDGWRLRREYPLASGLLAVTRVWEPQGGGSLVVAAKGAPEAIAGLCGLDAARQESLARQIGALASEGLRVLGVAKAGTGEGPLPDGPRSFRFEWLGLLGFADPIRPGAPDAIRRCDEAGIRVAMITGDYPATAAAIGRQIGLATENLLTGSDLEAISDADLPRRVRGTRLFARVVPEQKLRLVEALKMSGDIVAMTGDGVNDAPALKAAHIGIAMGGRGTDVAREAADLVLLDDDFSSVVGAIRLGRSIFDNLRKAMSYLLAIHVPIAGISLVPVLLRWPLVLMPIHILFLELVIDPACSIAFEAEPPEDDVMRRPPRPPREPLFSRRMVRRALVQGIGILAIVVTVYAIALGRGQQEGEVRALTFTTLVVANLSLILADRSASRSIRQTIRQRNAALWAIVCGAAGLMALVLAVPAFRRAFHFSALRPLDVAIALSGGILSVAWFEIFKLRQRRQAGRPVRSGVCP